jgi:hypothetical protein
MPEEMMSWIERMSGQRPEKLDMQTFILFSCLYQMDAKIDTFLGYCKVVDGISWRQKGVLIALGILATALGFLVKSHYVP